MFELPVLDDAIITEKNRNSESIQPSHIKTMNFKIISWQDI